MFGWWAKIVNLIDPDPPTPGSEEIARRGREAQEVTELCARLGIDRESPPWLENPRAMARLLDRIEALEAKG